MERKERYFHECPHCGLLTPWVQRKCDCGYVFQRAAPARSGVSVPVFVLSVLLALAVGLMAAGWRGTQPVSVVVSEAPAASAAPVSSAPAKSSFPDWSNQNVSPTPAPPTKTVENDGLPVLVGP